MSELFLNTPSFSMLETHSSNQQTTSSGEILLIWKEMDNWRKEMEKMKKSIDDKASPNPTSTNHIHKELSLQHEKNEKLEKENQSLKSEIKALKDQLNRRITSSEWKTETKPRPQPQVQLQNPNFQHPNYYQVLTNPPPQLHSYQYPQVQQRNGRISPPVNQQTHPDMTMQSYNNQRIIPVNNTS